MVFAAAVAVTFTAFLPLASAPSAPSNTGLPIESFVASGARVAPKDDARTVTVSSAGKLTIAGAPAPLDLLRVEKNLKRRAARFTATSAGAGDILVFVDTEYELTENGETGWLLDDMVAARVDKGGKLVWRQRLANRSGDPTRNVFITDKVIVMRERDGIEGVDAATGKKLWGVDRDSLESVLNDPHFWRASLDDKSGVLHVVGRFPLSTGDGRREFELELDAATGPRVFAKTKNATPRAEPIYVRPPFRLEYPSDRAPPVVPAQWDGLRIRRSYLAWSNSTGEGIVVGPLATDAQAIVAAAKAARVKGAAVKWLYAIDLPAIGRGAVVNGVDAIRREGEALKALGLKRLDDPIVLAHNGAIERAGERMDAASVAKALGATALDSGAALTTLAQPSGQPKAGAIAVFRGEEGDRKVTYDHATHVCMQWGPYVFVDEHPRDHRIEELPY